MTSCDTHRSLGKSTYTLAFYLFDRSSFFPSASHFSTSLCRLWSSCRAHSHSLSISLSLTHCFMYTMNGCLTHTLFCVFFFLFQNIRLAYDIELDFCYIANRLELKIALNFVQYNVEFH